MEPKPWATRRQNLTCPKFERQKHRSSERHRSVLIHTLFSKTEAAFYLLHARAEACGQISKTCFPSSVFGKKRFVTTPDMPEQLSIADFKAPHLDIPVIYHPHTNASLHNQNETPSCPIVCTDQNSKESPETDELAELALVQRRVNSKTLLKLLSFRSSRSGRRLSTWQRNSRLWVIRALACCENCEISSVYGAR